MQELAPIVLFVYNRPWHTEQAIESLKTNKLAAESDLVIYSDGPKSEKDKYTVKKVRDFVEKITGFKSIQIINRKQNFGLAGSVISGINDIFQNHNTAIVMEDDIVSSKNFLQFMNEALKIYEDDERIFSVSGYTFPLKIPKEYIDSTFISYRSSSWGWGTWKDRWLKVDWEINDYVEFKKDKNAQMLFNRGGEDLTPMLHSQMNSKIDSWAIRWAYAHFKNCAYCVFPVHSRIKNIGTDSSGTHSDTSSKFDVVIDDDEESTRLKRELALDSELVKNMQKFNRPKLFRRIVNRLRWN
ncbi:MAG: glycosyltransferase [Ignavibacteria bacterium]|nr:glycosyltransferase [Ignavibacteria bacterium]